jgi:hypothetical protein
MKIRRTPMICRIATSIFLLASWASPALAQFNLRTEPALPTAGAPFEVRFDGNPCQMFILPPYAPAPTVEVIGETVRVEVDYMNSFDCGAPYETSSVVVPGMPQGNYTLELVGRAFENHEYEGTLETIALPVAAAAVPARIPATNWLTNALLILAAAAVGMRWRRP